LFLIIAVQFGLNKGSIYKARLGEVGWESDWFGAKAGLSADTGSFIGTSGVGAKFLGSGFSLTRRGYETCFFGSCIRIG
jgi:hypothetical protein